MQTSAGMTSSLVAPQAGHVSTELRTGVNAAVIVSVLPKVGVERRL